MEEASAIIAQLTKASLSERDAKKLEKVLLLLLYGELYGLNSLNKLLNSYGVQSNDYQKLWSKLSCEKIVSLMNRWLWLLFLPEFIKCAAKSAATQSRLHPTLVIDGSIFMQWLKKNEAFGQYFAKYYSGQYGKAVYGLNVILCGMSIGDMFYPLHFQLRKKSEKDVDVAHRMLQKVQHKLSDICQEAVVDLPTLYLSVDSGFQSDAFVNWCEAIGIHYIGVPKTTHTVYLNTQTKEDKKAVNKRSIKDLKDEFVIREQVWEEARQASGDTKKDKKNEHFTWRIRVYYNCRDREVTLLLFRFQDSKKVTVIFCNDLNIKAITLRKRWFDRTKIENFFRLIKHSIKIQQSTTYDRLGFMKKFAFAMVKAVYAQILTQKVKKSDKSIRRIGYDKIKQLLIFHQIGKAFLDDLFYDRPFSSS